MNEKFSHKSPEVRAAIETHNIKGLRAMQKKSVQQRQLNMASRDIKNERDAQEIITVFDEANLLTDEGVHEISREKTDPKILKRMLEHIHALEAKHPR